jgi:anthranilate phosphoribosyltransferase
MVVHSDGLDEISPVVSTLVAELREGAIQRIRIDPGTSVFTLTVWRR